MRTKLREGETIQLQVRKHWIVLAKPALFVKIAIFAWFFFKRTHLFGLETLVLQMIPWAIVGTLMYFVYMWFDRRANIWVVTNFRVIDEWGIVNHTAKEAPLEMINNAICRTTPLGQILGFGDVVVETAARDGATVIRDVETPHKLQEAIMQGRENSSLRHERSGRTTIASAEDMDCPFCAEIIKKKAKVCRHCGRDLPSVSAEGVSKMPRWLPTQEPAQVEEAGATQGEAPESGPIEDKSYEPVLSLGGSASMKKRARNVTDADATTVTPEKPVTDTASDEGTADWDPKSAWKRK